MEDVPQFRIIKTAVQPDFSWDSLGTSKIKFTLTNLKEIKTLSGHDPVINAETA